MFKPRMVPVEDKKEKLKLCLMRASSELNAMAKDLEDIREKIQDLVELQNDVQKMLNDLHNLKIFQK